MRIADACDVIVVHPLESARDAIERIPLGSWVRVRGQRSGPELLGCSVEVLAEPTIEFPDLKSDWHRLHDNGRERLRNLRLRAALLTTLRAWFADREFLEVDTPVLVHSPGLDLHIAPVRVEGPAGKRWLNTSPELQMKRLLSAGLSRIYQIAYCVRAGEVGTHHEPEFRMVEWYRSPSTSEEVMRDTESIIAGAARALEHRGWTTDAWRRLRLEAAFREHTGTSLDTVLPDEERFFRMFAELVSPRLGIDRPTFVTHWPASMASLARLCPGEPQWADRFEGYIRGLEVCNGFGELTDAREQRARFETDQRRRRAQGLALPPIDERFLRALELGIPPSAGNALGFDRLLMLLTGANAIADVMPFPLCSLGN